MSEKKPTPRKKTPVKKSTPVKKATTKRTTSKKATEEKAPAPAKKTTATKSNARKTTAAKKAVAAKKAPIKKTPAKKAPAKKAPAKKTSAKKKPLSAHKLDRWICGKCNSNNSTSSQTCKKCGASIEQRKLIDGQVAPLPQPKPKLAEKSVPTTGRSTVRWVCSNCKTGNSPYSKTCKRCGHIKED